MIPNLPAICDTDASCDSVSTIQLLGYNAIQDWINGANTILSFLPVLISIIIGAAVVAVCWDTIIRQTTEIVRSRVYVGKHRKV